MKIYDILITLFVIAIWGATYSVTKLGLQGFDPFMLTAIRFLLAAIPMCFLVKFPKENILIIALYGIIFGVGLGDFLNLALMAGLSPGNSSILLQLNAFFTIMWGIIFFKESIKSSQYIGMLIAIAGFGIIIFYNNGRSLFLGIILIVVAALCWSICNAMVKKYQPRNLIAFMVWSSLFSTPPLFFIAYAIHGKVIFINLIHDVTIKTAGSILFQAYATTVFGYGIWNIMLKKYSAAMVAPFSLLVPIFGFIFSHLIFGEIININKIVATILVVCGIFIFYFAPKIIQIDTKK